MVPVNHHVYFDQFFAGLQPRADLTASQWADKYGRLIIEGSDHGPWRTRPTQRAILDAFSHPRIERISVQKSTRVGWTKILGHAIGYHIDQDPCSVLVIQPTTSDAENFGKEDVQPMIENTPVLAEKVMDMVSRKSGNTLTAKTYPGGILHLHGGNSPTGFRRITVRVFIIDECDALPPSAGVEGDQSKLGERRTGTYDERSIATGSTPTIDGFSRIQRAMTKSSEGYYMVPCPECGAEHTRKFRQPEKTIILRGKELPIAHLHWQDGKPETAAWVCPTCGVLIGHRHHRKLLKAGYWRGEHWEYRNEKFTLLPGFAGHVGFYLWAGFGDSPNTTPQKIVEEFLDSKDNPETLKTFVNTILGETWQEEGDTANEELISKRREKYPAEVPAGVLVLAMGVDVQADRIELEVCGYGAGEENWSIDYQILVGDTLQAEVWAELKTRIDVTYAHESGVKMSVSSVIIDSGFNTDEVYKFVREIKKNYVYAGKGMSGKRAIVEPMTERVRRLRKIQNKKKFQPELIGVDRAKAIIYSRLNKITAPGPGYSHFPEDRDDEFFAQLAAETAITKYTKGFPSVEWYLTRPRNEALDCRVYGYAALKLLNPDYESLKTSLTAPKRCVWQGLKMGKKQDEQARV